MMKPYELNKLLIDYFPQLKTKYEEEVEWQEGDNTGSHVVFGDVLTPHLISCIIEENYIEIEKIFSFLELLLKMNDDYTDEVVLYSVLESILHLYDKNEKLFEITGKLSKEYLKRYLKFEIIE